MNLNKLMEINVFSPGGVESAEHYTGVKFCQFLIEDLGRKLDARSGVAQTLSNRQLAVI